MQTAESIEKPIREQHEANTLMVFYTDPNDIPPTPKEPIELPGDEMDTMKDFGAPQGAVVERAARIVRDAAASSAATQFDQQATASPAVPDISAILAALNPQHTQAQSQQPSASQNPMLDLQKLLANFAPPPPLQMTQQVQPSSSQAALPPNIASIMANLQPQVGPASQIPQHQQQQYAAPADPNAANLAALFSQISQAHPNANGFGMNGFPGLPPSQSINQQQQGQSQYPYENEERRRWREANDDQGYDAEKQQGGGKKKREWKDKKYTLPCKYFSQGKCQKGDKCTYLHV